MATTKTKENKKEVVKTDKESKSKTHPLILGPRITEKGALASEKSAYTFNVKEESTKNEIKKAIKMIYGVDVVKVSVSPIREKVVVRKGKKGVRKGGKKAVVYLKKGEKISFA